MRLEGEDGGVVRGEVVEGIVGGHEWGVDFVGAEEGGPFGGGVGGIGGGGREIGVEDEVFGAGEGGVELGVRVVSFDFADVFKLGGGEGGKDGFDGEFGGICAGGDVYLGGFGGGGFGVEGEGKGAVADLAEDGLVGAEGLEGAGEVIIGGELGGHGDLEGGEGLVDLDVVFAVKVAGAGEFFGDGEAHFFGEGFVGIGGVDEGEDGEGGFGGLGLGVKEERGE